MRMRRKWEGNEKESFQLFVRVFDTCLVWYLLVFPSEAHVVANMNYLRAIDGNTSNHPHESFSFIAFLVQASSELDTIVKMALRSKALRIQGIARA